MGDLVWQDAELAVSTYIGPVKSARGPRTRVQVVTQYEVGGKQIISFDLKQWGSLHDAVMELGTNPHHKPPIMRHLSMPEPVGYVMPNGDAATRMDFIRAKLGTGEWPRALVIDEPESAQPSAG